MSAPAGAVVAAEEIRDIELVVLRRMREHAAGGHPSAFRGAGREPAGLRDWQPGDRPSDIDWPQSTLTNFAPLATREQEHESTARIVIVADTSLSTRCGVGGAPLAAIIARTVGTLALAGAFFQDQVGLVTFDGPRRRLAARPRVGRSHALHCFETYQAQAAGVAQASEGADGGAPGGALTWGADGGHSGAAGAAGPSGPPGGAARLATLLRRTALVPLVSDFLFEEAPALLAELAELHARHDAFVVLIDAAWAFDLPPPAAGWTRVADVETGRRAFVSARELRALPARVEEWQDGVAEQAETLGLEVLRVGADADRFHETVVDFLADRRARRR